MLYSGSGSRGVVQTLACKGKVRYVNFMDVRLGLNQLKNQIELAWTILDKEQINAVTFILKKSS